MSKSKKVKKNDDLFYQVEKIIKIIQEKNKKYAIVKWKKYVMPTKEPLEHLRSNLELAKQIERLQFQFQDSKKGNKSLKNLTQEYYEELKKSLFHCSEEDIIEQSTKKQKKNAIHQRALCREKAKKMLVQKVKYGLKDLNGKDYFYLVRLQHQLQDYLSIRKIHEDIPIYHSKKIFVKGMLINAQKHKFCISLHETIYICTQQEMKQHFPYTLINWLRKLIAYMNKFMPNEIKIEEQLIKKRRCRQNSVKFVKQMINIKEKLQAKKNPIFFGFDIEDIQNNKTKEAQKLIKQMIVEDSSKQMTQKLKLNPEHFLEQMNAFLKNAKKIESNISEKSQASSKRRSSRIQLKSKSKSKSNKSSKSDRQQESQLSSIHKFQRANSLSKSSKQPKRPSKTPKQRKIRKRKNNDKKSKKPLAKENFELSSQEDDNNKSNSKQFKLYQYNKQENKGDSSQENNLKSRLRRYSSNNSDSNEDMGRKPIKQVKL